jgi:hypothetical protein
MHPRQFQIVSYPAGRNILDQALGFDDVNWKLRLSRSATRADAVSNLLRNGLLITCQRPASKPRGMHSQNQEINPFSAPSSADAGMTDRTINKFSSVRQRALYLIKLFGIIDFVRALPELSTADARSTMNKELS